MQRKDVIRFLIFRTLGNFFILFTIFGFFATFGPVIYYEISYRVGSASGVRFSVQDEISKNSSLQQIIPQPTKTQESFLGAALKGEKQPVLVPKSADFSIIIPKIGANSPVIANTDPSNEKEYLNVLLKGVAHAKGSAFPGMNGNIYLFAHSVDNWWNVGRYNAVFYLLKELENGDEVIIIYAGRRYNYFVSEKKIVEASDLSYMAANIGVGETLILQTCWPPGTTWKRLLVFAKPRL